jgi:hypothetical protein
MGFMEGATGTFSDTCVMCDVDVDGSEEVSIKDEEAIDIKDEITEAVPFPPIKIEEATNTKDEIPEAHNFPPIKTELEVRLWS